jgi:hypothetical protein
MSVLSKNDLRYRLYVAGTRREQHCETKESREAMERTMKVVEQLREFHGGRG